MKILAIGDFHGKFPEKLKKIAKRKDIDLIVSPGDYMPFSYRKLWFKCCYGKDIELWEIIGKKKYKKLLLKDLRIGEKVIKKLNNLHVQVFTTIGNYDSSNINDQYPVNRWKSGWKWDNQNFLGNILKKYKNIKRFDYNFTKFKDIVFIGGFGHSSPGYVKSKTYRRYRAKLEKLFTKFRKENKNRKVIFVFHNMPYRCGKLDIITDKKADKRAKGEHYGSKLTRRIIDKYQPVLGIGGHMHENQGKCKIGRTIVVNTGAAADGKCAIIEFNEKKGKIKRVKFIE